MIEKSRKGEESHVSIAKVSGSRELDMDIIIPDNRFSDLSVMKVLEKI